ncbi:hypothetical protein P7H15_21745 [Paenibacillus larvae]|nr:hypothetical protein [Paenibacillus larvae]MDT2294902.1 hypothetical protein [Paenibacillus larvae]
MKGGVRKRYGSWYYYFDLGIVDGKRKRLSEKQSGRKQKVKRKNYYERL